MTSEYSVTIILSNKNSKLYVRDQYYYLNYFVHKHPFDAITKIKKYRNIPKTGTIF